MNIFDNLQDTLFGTVKSTMGYPAVWNPSVGGPAQTATVLYKGPTDREKLANVDFDIDQMTMEYSQGDFTGLYESVRDNKREPVTIQGVSGQDIQCVVVSARKLHDGKTIEARLKVKTA